MDVHLIGGGWDDDLAPTLYGPFVEAAARRAGGTPRIVLFVMGTDPESLEYHEKYVHTLGLVGGGPTPEYHASLEGAYHRIRALVSTGMPYAGFSAGAAIAGSHAVIGGWLLDGRPVCPEDSNEDLDDVAVVSGIGLVPGAVDVHAAQWGARAGSGRRSIGSAPCAPSRSPSPETPTASSSTRCPTPR